MYLLEIYVTNAALAVNRPFTYYSLKPAKIFTRVAVTFSNRRCLGFVTSVIETNHTLKQVSDELGFEPLEIIEKVDEEPILNQELFDLACWLSRTSVSPLISCLNVMLPKTLKTGVIAYKPTKIKYIRKLPNDKNIQLTIKQLAVYEQLVDGQTYSEASKLSRAIIKKLIEFGLIEIYLADKENIQTIGGQEHFKTLNSDQQKAYDNLIQSDKRVNLLYGVTGSGKTEVYLHLADYYLKRGQQVLILVPEISLTPQMIDRVKKRFSDVAIYHSYLNNQERHRQYFSVLKGEARIVVGTRSSVFLPFENLGLIIVDEEHDSSYKQDDTPCYNAKNVAFKRAIDFNAKVLLASATPTLESYSRALKGDYQLLELPKRINDCLPNINIIDLQKEIKMGGSYMIAKPLKTAIAKTLKENHQAIILLNRRGYSPVLRCDNCKETLMCGDCDVALSYHAYEHCLKCHVCGKTYKMPSVCPYCHQGRLSQFGFGTQKVVEELEKLFPEVKIGRMDADTTTRKNAHEELLSKFGHQEYQILVGTQMIAKGLDYPNVTLVGILNADAGLMHDDFNSAETTFALLMQASGRSGRAQNRGEVYIETFNPDHYVLKAVEHQNYREFYNIEMQYRRKAFYPPYSHIISIIIKDTNIKKLERSKNYLYDMINKLPYRKYRPVKLNKIKTFERYRFILRDQNLIDLLNDVHHLVDAYLKEKNLSNIKIDVDPLYLE